MSVVTAKPWFQTGLQKLMSAASLMLISEARRTATETAIATGTETVIVIAIKANRAVVVGSPRRRQFARAPVTARPGSRGSEEFHWRHGSFRGIGGSHGAHWRARGTLWRGTR